MVHQQDDGNSGRAPARGFQREVALRLGSHQHYVGLLPGDILVGSEGQFFSALEDLEDALEGSSERVLRLRFLRGDPGKIRTVAVRLGVGNSVAA